MTIAQQLNIKKFPFIIKDENGNEIYCENSAGVWHKREYDSKGKKIYYEHSHGVIIDNRPNKHKTMTKEQLIQIAKVGFPQIVHQQIDLENAEMFVMGNVYRLHNKDVKYGFCIPEREYLSIHIEEDFVQIQVEYRIFNHLAAIKEMEKMGII